MLIYTRYITNRYMLCIVRFTGWEFSEGFCWWSSFQYDRGQPENILPAMGRCDARSCYARPEHTAVFVSDI